MPIRVLIVNSQPVVRRGLVTLLRAYPDIDLVGESDSCEGCCRLTASASPDVLLCELDLPDACALDTLRRLRNTRVPVVVYTLHDDAHHIVQALRAGVRGFLSRRMGVEAVYEAIRAVAAGGSYMDPAISTRVMALARAPDEAVPDETSGLSDRQIDLLRLVAAGLSNREVAESMAVTVHTVKFHMRAILRKLRASSREQAVAVAAERGLLKLPSSERPAAS